MMRTPTCELHANGKWPRWNPSSAQSALGWILCLIAMLLAISLTGSCGIFSRKTCEPKTIPIQVERDCTDGIVPPRLEPVVELDECEAALCYDFENMKALLRNVRALRAYRDKVDDRCALAETPKP